MNTFGRLDDALNNAGSGGFPGLRAIGGSARCASEHVVITSAHFTVHGGVTAG